MAMSARLSRLLWMLACACAWIVIAAPLSVAIILAAATVHGSAPGGSSHAPSKWLTPLVSSVLLSAGGVAIGAAVSIPVRLWGGHARSLAASLARWSAAFLRCVPAVVLGAIVVRLMGRGWLNPGDVSAQWAAVAALGLIAIPVLTSQLDAAPNRAQRELLEAAAALGASEDQCATTASLPGLAVRAPTALGVAFVRLLPEATAVQIILGRPGGAHHWLPSAPLGARLLGAVAVGTGPSGLASGALLLLIAGALASYLVRRPGPARQWV